MHHHNITVVNDLFKGPTSNASKIDGNVFYHVYKRSFYFYDKKRVLTFIFIFPNVYYIYACQQH